MQQIDTVEYVLGSLQQVDAVAREIVVLSDRGTVIFDVPPDCPIYLRGEAIKLRMVQPEDRVRVTFARCREYLVARLLEVQPIIDSPSVKVSHSSSQCE